MSEIQTYTFSVKVENKFGVLARIAGLFSGRGYNISSLTVNATHNPGVSRMIIVTRGTDAVVEQIEKQLNKLVEVIQVQRLSRESFVERELALFKLAADTPQKKAQVIQLVEIFSGKFVTVGPTELGVEISGRATQIDNFMNMVRDIGIIEMARSGRVAVARALIASPEVVLADEPTGNLDIEGTRVLCELLRGVNESERSAVLLVTHDPVVAACAQTVHFLKDGRIAASHDPKGDPARVSELYLEICR